MHDAPNAPYFNRPFGWKDWTLPLNTAILRLLDQEFTTCVVCLKGLEKGKSYGCFTWGHHIELTESGYKYYRYLGSHAANSVGDTATLDVPPLAPPL